MNISGAKATGLTSMQHQDMLQYRPDLHWQKMAWSSNLHASSLCGGEELEADSRLHSASAATPLVCSGSRYPPLGQAAYAPFRVVAAHMTVTAWPVLSML